MKLRCLTLISARGSRCTALFGLHPSFFTRNRKYFLFFFLALSWEVHLQAQLSLSLKAKSLNVFVPLRQSQTAPPDVIDVLSSSELGSCGTSNTGVELLAEASQGTASLDPVSKNILYTPNNNFSGQDSLKYRLTCGSQTSTAVVLINVGDKPEVIKNNACAVDPNPMVWGVRNSWSSSAIVSPLVTPLVGNLDGDDKPEIVCIGNQGGGTIDAAAGGSTGLLTLLIFDGETKTLKDSIRLPSFMSGYDAVPYGLVKLSDRRGLIVTATADCKLRAYQLDGSVTDLTSNTPVWVSNVYSTNPKDCAPNIAFYDFNHDGWPEICVLNKIYDAATGIFLQEASGGNNTGASYAHYSHTTGRKLSSPIAADVIGDHNLELILGNEIYNVNISTDRSQLGNPAVNSITLASGTSGTINPPDGVVADGHAQAADFNKDGHLDIFISNRNIAASTPGGIVSAYIWDVHNNRVSQPISIKNHMSGKSIPLIADVDNDGQLEIVIQSAVQDSTKKIQCYKYDPVSMEFSYLWGIAPDEDSYSNTMTLFDFNQDGLNEVLVTDQKQIRIFNGSGVSHLTRNDTLPVYQMAAFNFSETTIMQCPIIADIDDDGSAEIVACGSNMLNIFKSINEDSPWAPARPVWNQYVYNPVYINDDLTVPAYPLNPATRFTDFDGNYFQPFNNVLQQATLLNGEGKMLAYGPKLEYDNTDGAPITYTNITSNAATAHFSVLNTGDADFKGPLSVSAYFLKDGSFEYLCSMEVPGNIDINDPKPVNFLINFGGLVIEDLSLIQIRLNDDGSGDPVSPLCSYFGTYSKPPFQAPNYFVRANTENTIYFYPQNSGYVYRWYDKSPNVANPIDKPKAVGQGDSYSFIPKNTIEEFHVEIYNGDNLSTPIELYSPITSICVPDSLVWTGSATAGSQDWNDPKNWYYPHDPDPENTRMDTLRYKAPGVYTRVLIPGKLAAPQNYPDLTAGKTNYTNSNVNVPYTSAFCDMVYFAHGGELLRTDLLTYSKACVNLTVQANRWYMFSPPLHSMYSGDFYRTTPNPFATSEQQTTYTMLYNAENPEVGGSYLSGNWTGVFNTPNRPLHPGSGIAVWIDKHDTDYGEHPEVTLAFPKNDTAHYLYNPLRPADANISSPPMLTPRSQNGRFIYEGDDEKIAADGNITLQDMAGQKSGSVLVGNPFMAHLDFNEFYKANAAALGGSNQYKLAAGVDEDNNGVISTFYSYLRNGSEYISTAPDGLPGNSSGRIPPMQAFIIDVTGESVQANISHTVTSVAEVDTFRSAVSAFRSSGHLLQILATCGAAISKTLILQGAAYSTNYLPSEDSYKLFVSGMALDPETALDVLKPVQVYTRSSDGYALDINLIGTSEQDITVPLGIRTSEKGEIVLNFSGMESFGEETGIYLYDTQYPERLIDLSTQPEYAFDKTEDTLYLENRLSLIIGKNTLARPLGFSNVSGISAARIISRPHGMLRIISENGKTLGDIRITDSWGRLLLDVSAVSSSVYEYQTPTPGIYIVRVGAEVKKVVSIQ